MDNTQTITKFIFDELVSEGSMLDDKERVCFLEYDDGYTLSPKCKIRSDVKSGLYEIIGSREGLYFQKKSVILDDYIDLNNAHEQLLIRDILAFGQKAELFKVNGVVHKRGILLYGKPGCGKTSFIHSFLNQFISSGGIVFLIKNINQFFDTIEGLKQLRTILPDRQVVIVIEEIDKFETNYSELQNFLDGQSSLPHVVTIATTNYINELPAALLRPSRFDWIIEFGILTDEARGKYLLGKGVSKKEIDKWVKDTDQFTVAMLKELFISVKLLDNDYTTTLNKIRDTEKHAKTSTYTGIGFKTKK